MAQKDTERKLLPGIVLCGYERGGTTLIAEVFRANGYKSGFECGVLMCDCPANFLNYKPYIDMLADGWGIEPHEIAGICNGTFEDFYERLISLAFPDSNKINKFFDKTPIYMSKLGQVLNRTDFIDKACVIHRDPRSVFVSWAKRVGKGRDIERTVRKHLNNFCARYLNYFIGCAAHINNPSVLFIPFEEFCLREDFYYQAIGLFSEGRAFEPRTERSQFENVTGTGMDHDKVFEFEKYLSKKTQNDILESTRLASIFFANAEDRIKYGDYWSEMKTKTECLLKNFDILDAYATEVNGIYFEPMTYLILYPDVLNAKVNPINHFRDYGVLEKRRAS